MSSENIFSTKSIKDLCEENYLIIIDTNVLLNIYNFSPEFSSFSLQCLEAIKDNIILPATVYLEYSKHRQKLYRQMYNRINKVHEITSKEVAKAGNSIMNIVNHLEYLKLPNLSNVKLALENKLEEINNEFEDYFVDNKELSLIAKQWEKDFLEEYVLGLKENKKILSEPNQEEIYNWCEEGVRRYKKEVPPGFKDASKKEGIRKYNDLIIWKEILRFAQNQEKNIIFVTDDVKRDWWDKDECGEIVLHQSLVNEFKRTGQEIIAITSNELYKQISDTYGIKKTDAVDIALNMTDEEYYSNVEEQVFDEIIDMLSYSDTRYIDMDSAHIGSEGISELEVDEYDFVYAERIGRDENIVIYLFHYRVCAEGVSHDYWGRDDDTREVILSYGTRHEFEGEIVVEVQREIEFFIDESPGMDISFYNAEIVEGSLKELKYKEYNDYDYEPEIGELGNCPECGEPLNMENDGGNGFCVNCASKY